MWGAQLVSNIGTYMQLATVPFVLDHLTGSTLWVGLGIFASFFPVVLIGPLGGSLADRHPRRNVLLWSQGVMMIGATALWLVWITGAATPGVVIACVAVTGFGNGVVSPAWNSFVPELVPSEHMLNAVRLSLAQVYASRAVGPAIAGAVLAGWGAGAAFLTNALSFVVVIVALFTVAAKPVGPAARAAAKGAFRDTLAYAWRRRALILAIVSIVFYSLFGGAMMQLAEPFARHVFHVGAGAYGVMVAVGGAGAFCSAIVVLLIGDRVRRSVLTLIGLAIFLAAQALFGAAPGYALGLTALGLMGVGSVVITTSLTTSVQAIVDPDYRGRVMGLLIIGINAGIPLGTMLAATTSEVIGLRTTVLAGGAVLLAYALLGVFCFDRFRSLDGDRGGRLAAGVARRAA